MTMIDRDVIGNENVCSERLKHSCRHWLYCVAI